MSDTATPVAPSAVEAAIAKAKAAYGDLVTLTLDGHKLGFKRLDKAKVTDMRKQISKSPDLAIEISVNVCGFCCVVGREHFDELSAKYPLAFCGTEGIKGVIDVLMDLARGGEDGPGIRVE